MLEDHALLGTDNSTSPLDHPSARWRCSCGVVSRWLQPQHVTRSHALHRHSALNGPNRTRMQR